jgi:FeoB-associated Cys-rich membrane protein
MGRMLASATQAFGVILILAAAAGYLGLRLRRSSKRGGCCSCSDVLCRRDGTEPGSPSSREQRFVPGEDLAEQARRLAKNDASADQTR